MMTDTQKELEKIFMSYNRVLQKLKLLNIKTKSNKEITHKDLRQAIDIMNRKHPTCRWKCQKAKRNKHYILTEGFYWLIYVYFQNKKSLIDADVEFFTNRITLYENLLLIEPKVLWENDMFVYELQEYFQRSIGTIKNNIIKMNKVTNNSYRYYENGNYKITKTGIEWLCKNCFKHKYLQLLETYKMELTEKYIVAGYPYDIF